MRKVLNVFKVILLLAWLVFLILCCHSCIMKINSTMGENASPVLSSSPGSSSGANTAAPAQTKEDAVTLSSGDVPLTAETLEAVVVPSDLPLLDSLTALKSADFSGSTCYSEIFAWAQAHPGVSVRYTVTLPDGQTVSSDAESLDLSGMNPADAAAAAELLRYLPNLTAVNLGSAQSGSMISTEDLAAIADACPSAVLNYSLSFKGQSLPLDSTELDFSGITPADVAEAASVLRCMNQVSLVHLGSADSGLTLGDIAQLHDAAPDAALDYPVSVWGVDFNLADTDLSFSHIKMNDEGAAVKQVLPYMANLKTLDMDSCDVSNEAMAGIREENPGVDVIWRVWFAGYSVRTDVERILASSKERGGTVTDDAARCLQYCNHVKYLDLGHNQELTDISFVRGMPDLEVAIFAINDISDASPLADCPKLEYLEINSTNITDLTPLQNLTGLHHLNIGRCVSNGENDGSDEKRPRVTDISPLFGMTELERLYIGSLTSPGIPKEQLDTMAEAMGVEKDASGNFTKDDEGNYCDSKVSPEGLPYKYIRINTSSGDPSQGAWRTAGYRPDWVWQQWLETGSFNDPLNERYKLLREQFGYDTADQSYSLPQNDPLY